jgi:hypothetical protein
MFIKNQEMNIGERLLADIQKIKAQQGLPEDVLVSLEVIEEECAKD